MGGQASDPRGGANTTGYASPIISSIGGVNASAEPFPEWKNMDTDGGTEIIIQGFNMGVHHEGNQVAGSYVNPGLIGLGGSLYNASTCWVSVNHTEVTCVAVAGVGHGFFWELRVGEQISSYAVDDYSVIGRSEQLGVTTAYIPSVVTGLSHLSEANASFDAALDMHSLDPEGGQQILVSGDGFGPGDPSNIPSVTLTSTLLTGFGSTLEAVDCAVLNDTSLMCSTPEGVGALHAWTVSVGDQRGGWSGNLARSSYAPPTLESLSALMGVDETALSTRGGDRILLNGSRFGPDRPDNFVSAR